MAEQSIEKTPGGAVKLPPNSYTEVVPVPVKNTSPNITSRIVNSSTMNAEKSGGCGCGRKKR